MYYLLKGWLDLNLLILFGEWMYGLNYKNYVVIVVIFEVIDG